MEIAALPSCEKSLFAGAKIVFFLILKVKSSVFPFCVSFLEKCPILKSNGKSEGRNLGCLFLGLYGDSFAHG